MRRTSEAAYRAILRLPPRAFRARRRAELEEAFADCLRRERSRMGIPGVVYA